MKPVVIGDDAQDEIAEDVRFYDSRRPGKGDEFAAAVAESVNRIGTSPRAFAPHHSGYRKLRVNGFPHMVFYFEYDTYVWVAAVAHGSRKPDYWINRQPDSN